MEKKSNEWTTPRAARLKLWTELELLAPEDLLHPLAVLVQPAVAVTAFPPRPARLS